MVSQKYLRLFESNSGDIKLFFNDGSTYNVHKHIICDNNMFQCVLNGKSDESTKNEIDLTNYEKENIFRVIKYMYTDTVEYDNVEQLVEIYKLSDVLNIESLNHTIMNEIHAEFDNILK